MPGKGCSQGRVRKIGDFSAVTIIQRRQAEKTLQESEERLRVALEGTTDGIWDWDLRTGQAYFSPRYYTMLGYEPGEFPPAYESWRQLLHPDDAAAVEQAVQHALAEHTPFAVEARLKAKNGEWRWILGRGKVVELDKGGKAVRMAGSHTDITERKRMEEALRASERRLREAQQLAHLGNWFWDVNSGAVEWSDEVYRIFRLDPEEFTPQIDSILALSPWLEDHQRDQELIQRAVESREAGSYEQKFLRPDGSTGYYFSTFQGVYDDDGTLTAITGTVQDITERKMAEKALQESEERYRTLVRNFPNGAVTLFDHDLRYMIADGIGLAAVGLSPKLMEGKTIWEMFPPEICEAIEPDHRSALAGRTTINRVLYKDHVYLTHTLPVRNEQGQIIAGMVMTQDITEQVQVEKAIQQYTTRLESQRRIDQAILEAQSLKETAQSALKHIYQLLPFNRISVVLFDFKTQQGAVLAVYSSEETKPGAELTVPLTTFGYIVDEIRSGKTRLVKNMQTLTQLTPMDSNLLAEGVLSYINIPLIARGDLIGMLNLGANEPDAFSEAHIEVAQEVADQLAVAIQQAYLHEQVQRYADQLESRVEERTAQLEAANKELEAFSYSVSHDLRAPLRAIDGYTRILMQDYESALDAEGRRICSVIRHQTGRMSQLIDDLLAFSRLGRAQMQAVPIDMERLARAVFDELTTAESRERLDFRIGSLPPVVGDPALIRQVWTNLLANALKFSSKRERAVIEVDSRQGDGEIVYWVRDNGAGFDMGYAKKLFGVFQRLHNEKEFAGTGVGLAIVQRVIHRHGGRVWAESAVDQGAAFYFTLPR